jgi:hypothetical protein
VLARSRQLMDDEANWYKAVPQSSSEAGFLWRVPIYSYCDKRCGASLRGMGFLSRDHALTDTGRPRRPIVLCIVVNVRSQKFLSAFKLRRLSLFFMNHLFLSLSQRVSQCQREYVSSSDPRRAGSGCPPILELFVASPLVIRVPADAVVVNDSFMAGRSLPSFLC